MESVRTVALRLASNHLTSIDRGSCPSYGESARHSESYTLHPRSNAQYHGCINSKMQPARMHAMNR